MGQLLSGKNQEGYLAIFAVIIVGSIVLISLLSFSVLGYKSILTSRTFLELNKARALTISCAEIALNQIKNNNFVGSDSLTLAEGSCSYVVLDLGAENRQLNISGNYQNNIRKAQLIVNQITPQLTISSWLEVANF